MDPLALPLSYHACYLLGALAWLVAAGAVWRSLRSPNLKIIVGMGVIGTTVCLLIGGRMMANLIWASKLVTEARSKIAPPAKTAEAETAPLPVDIRIECLDDNQLRWNGRLIPLADMENTLPELLKDAPPDPEIEILAAASVSYSIVTRILELLEKSGIHRVSFQAGKQS
ncbi:biopolymer transporter ExbD [Luteolibacter sp. LG18]|uniref:ExbD/TolR family protein n=1 Tax=Luteolibacter sp. LG18 TaxID=2819286 RepID=UPI002B2B3847|nr:hypothetical protein llg_44650 [Luteolibacter sp. LG18]